MLCLDVDHENPSLLPDRFFGDSCGHGRIGRAGDRDRFRCLPSELEHEAEVHLQFPQATLLEYAHRLATFVEERLPIKLGVPK